MSAKQNIVNDYRLLLAIGFIVAIFACMPAVAQQGDEAINPNELKKLSIEELMKVEVTSVSRRSEKLTEVASAIQVITKEDIRRSGATSIPEALRLATNLHVAQKNSHDWAISARGFNTDLANKLLVLIDGRTVYTPLFSGVFWDRQDYLLEDIERIEVISGPGGTLWGSNAVNGVINIITKKSVDSQGLYAEAGAGNQVRGFGGLRYGGKIGSTVTYRVYGKYTDRDEAVLPEGKGAADSWRMGQGGFRLEATPSDKNAFTFQGDYYKSGVNLSTGGKSDVNGVNVMGRWSHSFSERSETILQLYYDRTYLDQPVPEARTSDNSLVLAPAGHLKDELHTYDLDFQHSFSVGDRNHLVWGLGYRFTHDKITNAPALAFVPEELDRNLISLFAQDELTVTKNILVTLGTKVEHNDYTKFEVEPSLRLQYHLTEKQSLWSAVSRAVRIPSRVDRHIRLPTPGFSPIIDNLLVGGQDFDSETVIAYELGYRGQFNSKITSSVSVFYNVYDKIRSTSPSPPPGFLGLPLFYENNLEGETFGLEFTSTCQVTDWWRMVGGYTLFREDIRIKEGKTDFNNALNETADPRHRLLLQSFMNLNKKFSLDTRLRFVDSFVYSNSGVATTMSDYTELEIRLGYSPTRNLEFSVAGQNLLNDQHGEYVISSPNPRVEIERSVYLKAACRF